MPVSTEEIMQGKHQLWQYQSGDQDLWQMNGGLGWGGS